MRRLPTRCFVEAACFPRRMPAATWSWQSGSGWVEYSSEVAHLLEQAWTGFNATGEALVVPVDSERFVSVSKMKQERIGMLGRNRAVRRHVPVLTAGSGVGESDTESRHTVRFGFRADYPISLDDSDEEREQAAGQADASSPRHSVESSHTKRPRFAAREATATSLGTTAPQIEPAWRLNRLNSAWSPCLPTAANTGTTQLSSLLSASELSGASEVILHSSPTYPTSIHVPHLELPRR